MMQTCLSTPMPIGRSTATTNDEQRMTGMTICCPLPTRSRPYMTPFRKLMRLLWMLSISGCCYSIRHQTRS